VSSVMLDRIDDYCTTLQAHSPPLMDVIEWPPTQWGFERMSNGKYLVRIQPIDATHALNRSAGVSYSRVLRGRSFNRRATAFSFA
jgi:hypothetical protein